MPIFQSPDEDAHADYALALYSVGRPFTVDRPRCANDVTEEVRHLARLSKYYGVRFLGNARVPDGYGTTAFFRAIDSSAPGRHPAVPRADSELSCLSFIYPAGYYAIVAAIFAIGHTVSNGSLMAAFFAARSFSVICLCITLPMAYRVFRANGLPQRTSLIGIAALGLLPMTSWVSAYIQPDNLTLTVTTVGLVFALRWKRRPFDLVSSSLLAVTMSALFFVKQQYAGVVYVSCMILVGSYLRRRTIPLGRRALSAVLVLLLPLLALRLSSFATPAGNLQIPASIAPPAYVRPEIGLLGSALEITVYAAIALRDAYYSGISFHRFWNSFGWTDVSFFSSHTVTATIEGVLGAISLAIACLFLVRQLGVMRRCLLIAASRSMACAASLLCRDVIVNMYLLWTALLIAVFAVSRGAWLLQGRYWLPMIVPMIVILLCKVPRVFPSHLRARGSLLLATSLLIYALFSAPFAMGAAYARYYGTNSAPELAAVTEISGVRILGASDDPLPHITTRRSNDERISGFAFKASDGSCVQRVEIRIDGKPIHTSYGSMVPTGYAPLPIGFWSSIPKNTLDFGPHLLSIAVFVDRLHVDRWVDKITLDVLR